MRENLFIQEMKDIRRELNALKIAKEKAAMNFRVKAQQRNVTLTMNANGYVTGLNVMSDKYAKIIATSKNGKNMLGSCTLREGDGRTLDLKRILSGTGELGWYFIIMDGTEDDWRIVTEGGAVSVTYTLDIQTTSDCDITISYEDNPYAPA